MQKIYLSLHINCDLSDVSLHDPAGIAHGNAAVRDILHHDAPGSYGYVASDGNPGRMVTEPPIQTLSPMVTGFAHSLREFLSMGSVL